MIGLLTGFIASTAHVITGPDHLAAVTPLAIDSRKKSWIIGLSWGIGHTLGMLLIGTLFILLKGILPVEKISAHSEIIVGILLIMIGSWAIFKILRKKNPYAHAHPHVHTQPSFFIHIHRHSHHEHPDHVHAHKKDYRQNAGTALIVGIVHGISGFSHLLAVLPALALPSMASAVFYLTGFAIGTILTMVLFALILGTVAYRSSLQKKSGFLFGFSLTGGILAITVGIFWIISGF
ncbi:MAG: sulfite exporter TauE/SafE family protein [Bacteroidetes bacterium]|nr:sulfite exporter TauE/SafE family protein [Bacteroidota bacterium]